MKKLNILTPSGFPEFSPAQEAVKQHWIRIIEQTFESYGFASITTPLVERQENLVAKGGDPKEMYVLKRLYDQEDDPSHTGNALRFDHTVPLALYVARHFNEIKFPFKRYTMGPVLRGERAQKGRFRQFDQCDIDIIGSENLSLAHDALMPAIIVEIFQKLRLGDFLVRINNRKILIGFFEHLGIAPDQIKDVLGVLDSFEKKPASETKKAFSSLGIKEKEAEKILNFTALKGKDNQTILRSLETVKAGEVFEEGFKELREVCEILDMMGCSPFVRIDLKIARGLDYYTGTVFETYLLKDNGSLDTALGSICSGGRYDDLASIFTGKSLPGVGISIGLTRLLSQLFEAQMITPRRSSPSQVLVALQDAAYLSQAITMARFLRGAGIRVENYLEPKKMAKQFEYADRLGIPYTVVIGEDEVKNNTLGVKNLSTGEQKTGSPAEILNYLKDNL